MKLLSKIVLLLLLPFSLVAQDTTITISPQTMKSNSIALGDIDGWLFRKGNDIFWARKEIDTTGWQKIKPSQLSGKLADKNGKLEGWLRIKIKLDPAFSDTTFDLYMTVWAASDVYVDGSLLCTFGNTGVNGKAFEEYNPNYKPPLPFNLEKGNEHILAIHFVDFLSALPPYNLKSKDQNRIGSFIIITTPEFRKLDLDLTLTFHAFRTIWLTVNIILCLLFWLLAFQNRNEKNFFIIAVYTTVYAFAIYCDQSIPTPGFTYAFYAFLFLAWAILVSLCGIFSLLLMLRIFKRKISLWFKISLWLIFAAGIAIVFLQSVYPLIFEIVLIIINYAYYITTSWKTLKGAQWAVIVGIILAFSFGLSLATSGVVAPENYSLGLLFYTGLFLSSPLSLLVYVAMRFKEIIKEVRDNAKQVVQLSEEKKEQALNQQKILQEEVNRQTAELRNTLDNLKSTQSQLIQSEKMASLGELTAGIAHEIQNPLNFVNNFSEVNSELIKELKSEASKGNFEEVSAIASDIESNSEKINHHGKRADAIVKNMLQHSRSSSGKKEPTDINALTDEYLRLAYHGLRAKDKSFNADIKTDFDNNIGKINIIPQDIGRVVLNLINNAFYAVDEKKKQNSNRYEPTVSISTKKFNGKSDSYRIEISVKDNGNGIPQKVLDKIFQPFFTTKPTGQGTGLGLSLSYDIVKAHGGEIKVETKEGEGSEFIIQLRTS
jgi:two-component system NtrC family sensor kinase